MPLEFGGWAKLDRIASAMRRSRREFRIFDGRFLRMFLETTDETGRFELDAQDRVRKIPREMRGAKPPPSAEKGAGTSQSSTDVIPVDSAEAELFL